MRLLYTALLLLPLSVGAHHLSDHYVGYMGINNDCDRDILWGQVGCPNARDGQSVVLPPADPDVVDYMNSNMLWGDNEEFQRINR